MCNNSPFLRIFLAYNYGTLPYLPFTVHFFYRPFHLTFLGYGSWFQCFGFNCKHRVSTFSLSSPSSLEDGGKWLLGLTWSSLLETHLLLVSYIPVLCRFGHSVSQSILVLWPLLWLISLIKLLFCARITFSRPFLFRALLKN